MYDLLTAICTLTILHPFWPGQKLDLLARLLPIVLGISITIVPQSDVKRNIKLISNTYIYPMKRASRNRALSSGAKVDLLKG